MTKVDRRTPRLTNDEGAKTAWLNQAAHRMMGCQFVAIIEDSNQQIWLKPLPVMGPRVLDIVSINFYGSDMGPARIACHKLPKGKFMLEWNDQDEAAKLIPIIELAK